MEVTGSGTLTGPTGITSRSDVLRIGTGDFDQIKNEFSFGTSTDHIKEWYHAERTLTAGSNDDLDLAGSLTNIFGTITFAAIKVIVIDIDAPDGTKSLRFGPQGVANAWQGMHGGVAAGNYITIHDTFYQVHSFAGWTVTAGTGDILRINNPGAGSVTYRIFLAGMI